MNRTLSLLARATARVALPLSLGTPLAAQSIAVPFDTGRWSIDAPRAELLEHLGRPSLHLAGGSALLKNVELQDGTLDVDVSAPDGGFAFLFFRAASRTDREDVYLRMGAPGSPDALQYQPTFHGMGSWQLYHGAGFTAPVSFDPKGWTHLRVEIDGRRARVFVGDTTALALEVAELKSDRTTGAIGVLEGTSGGTPPGVYFSNFRYAARPATHAAASTPSPSTRPSVIRRWELSPSVAVDYAPVDSIPTVLRGTTQWLAVDAEPNGVLNIARYRPSAGFRSLVVARTRVHADRDEVRRLVFGYSDDVTIFLDGRPVYAGRNGFRARYPSAAGLMTPDDGVYLSLKRGDHEIAFAVAEVFGGWGLMALLEPAAARVSSAPHALAGEVFPESTWGTMADLGPLATH